MRCALTSEPQQDGYSVIEIVVVVFVLGILASISLPNVFRLSTIARIDEAKTLLNTAAADCLEKTRINDPQRKDTIDAEILSDKRLDTMGYKIDPDADKCSYLQLLPINKEDEIRFPIGFSVSNGELSKFATPTSTDATSKSSCENWAGINCKEDQALKDLIIYSKEIEAAKKACTDTFNSKTSGKNTDGAFLYWNSNATKDCPKRPPKVVSDTCTTNGCNKTTYFCDGVNLRTDDPDAYDQCWITKGQQACIEWQAQQRAAKIDNPRGEYTTFTSCRSGAQKFWFCNGDNLGDVDSMNACLDEKKSTACQVSLNDKIAASAKGNFNGEYTPEKGGPGICAETVWLCKGSKLQSEAAYEDSTCKTPPPPPKKACPPRDANLCKALNSPYFCAPKPTC